MTKFPGSDVSYGTMDFTVERYHSMIEAGLLGPEDKVELLYGKIIPMNPIGRFHAACVQGFCETYYPMLIGKYTLRSQDPITILPLSEPEADFVVAVFDEFRYAAGHPSPRQVVLLVEVSDSTLDKDREYKLPLYAMNGIVEYWIVNLVDRQFEVYTQPREEGTYAEKAIYSDGQTFEHSILGLVDTAQLLPRIRTIGQN